jgi:hypothetical protein
MAATTRAAARIVRAFALALMRAEVRDRLTDVAA